MKKVTKTTVIEKNGDGRIIRETITTVEEEILSPLPTSTLTKTPIALYSTGALTAKSVTDPT